MTAPMHIPNHEATALARWTSVFKRAGALPSKIGVAFTAVMRQVQDTEDVIFSLIYDRLLNSALGVALDQVGGLVGEVRQALADGEYRRYIAARIRTNMTGGEPDDLIWILKTITGADDVLLFQFPKAAVELQYLVGVALTTVQSTRVGEHLLTSLAAGVSLDLVEVHGPPAFGFLDTPGAYGFGDGLFASVILTEG